MIRVRRIEPQDGPLLRATRIAALEDRPGDSATTVAAARAHSDEHWRDAAEANASGFSLATFFAVTDDPQDVVGMVGVYAMADGMATMVGLWTAPEHRASRADSDPSAPSVDPGGSVADGLVAAAAGWAREAGSDRLRLWVVRRNEFAIRFYESKGFQATGRTMPFEPEPTISQVEMVLPLG